MATTGICILTWVNAFKREGEYCAHTEKLWLIAIDPLFEVNATAHESRGAACRTGESVIAVDGDGVIRRCHFVPTPIGNLYEAGWEDVLQHRACPNDTCGCHIGYVHMNRLELYETFADGVLERVPRDWPLA